MELKGMRLAAVAVAVAGLAAGAYYLGTQKQADEGATSAPLVYTATLDVGNEQAPNEGRFGLAGSSAKYAHFRVGNKNVKSIYAEGDVVWVGTSAGLIRYDTKTDTYKLYDNRGPLLSNGIFYVGKLRGLIAVGTYGGGLSLLNEATGEWKHYNIPEGVGDAFIYEALEMKNGDIWIATWSGANRIRGGDLDNRAQWDLFTVENTHGGLPNDWVYGLAEGQNGDVWLATEGGMALFRNNEWQNWNHAKGIGTPYEVVKSAIEFRNDPGNASVHHAKQKQEMGLEGVSVAYNPNYIVALEVARDGKVWAGTWGGGLTIWDGQKWTNYSSLDGLPGNHVFYLHEDAKGQMWIGTNQGLALWQNGKFKTLTMADGLYDNNVFSMATTPEGGMWIGSFGGVAYIRPHK